MNLILRNTDRIEMSMAEFIDFTKSVVKEAVAETYGEYMSPAFSVCKPIPYTEYGVPMLSCPYTLKMNIDKNVIRNILFIIVRYRRMILG